MSNQTQTNESSEEETRMIRVVRLDTLQAFQLSNEIPVYPLYCIFKCIPKHLCQMFCHIELY